MSAWRRVDMEEAIELANEAMAEAVAAIRTALAGEDLTAHEQDLALGRVQAVLDAAYAYSLASIRAAFDNLPTTLH